MYLKKHETLLYINNINRKFKRTFSYPSTKRLQNPGTYKDKTV